MWPVFRPPGGNGNVKLEFTVTEDSTGYQEKTDNLLTVSQSSVNLTDHSLRINLQTRFTLQLSGHLRDPGQQAGRCHVLSASISYLDKNFQEIKNEDQTAGYQPKAKRCLKLIRRRIA